MDHTVRSLLKNQLAGVLSPPPLHALMMRIGELADRRVTSLSVAERHSCQERVGRVVETFCSDRRQGAAACRATAMALGVDETGGPAGHIALPREVVLVVRGIDEVVQARMAARDCARQLGFNDYASVKIATAASELARNIVFYAKSGSMEVKSTLAERPRRTGLKLIASDQGPGIANLEEILGGTYRSAHGMGLGLRGVKQLMDDFTIDTGPGRGTRVTTIKWL